MPFDWSYTLSLFSYLPLWKAALTVVELSVASWLAGIVIGFFLALGKQSTVGAVRWPAIVYIWFFRSIPLLVLLIFVYNIPQVLRATGAFLSNPFIAGLVALVLSESAYIAEIHRGGLLSVPRGQVEAGKALGMHYFGIQRLIVIPQAIRIALPTLGNEYVTIVKLTSLVSVISLAEILLVGERLYTRNFKVLETMLAVAVYYVFIVTISDNALAYIERRLDVRRKRTRPIAKAAVPAHAGRVKPARADAGARRDEAAPVLEAEAISKRFGKTEVLKGINLSVHRGEVISIIGPSGSGKTTFIRTLNGLELPDAGTIRLAGEEFYVRTPGRDGKAGRSKMPSLPQVRRIGMVFQQFNLFPHKTALQNVTLGPRYHKADTRAAIAEQGLAMLDKVGLIEHAHKYPHELSGGQQQRVAIARALAMRPSVLLFDEPTSALDPELVREVLNVIEELAREGLTMVIVTHEMSFAYRISDTVVFMDHGRVVNQGKPDEIFKGREDTRIGHFLRDIKVH